MFVISPQLIIDGYLSPEQIGEVGEFLVRLMIACFESIGFLLPLEGRMQFLLALIGIDKVVAIEFFLGDVHAQFAVGRQGLLVGFLGVEADYFDFAVGRHPD